MQQLEEGNPTTPDNRAAEEVQAIIGGDALAAETPFGVRTLDARGMLRMECKSPTGLIHGKLCVVSGELGRTQHVGVIEANREDLRHEFGRQSTRYMVRRTRNPDYPGQVHRTTFKGLHFWRATRARRVEHRFSIENGAWTGGTAGQLMPDIIQTTNVVLNELRQRLVSG